MGIDLKKIEKVSEYIDLGKKLSGVVTDEHSGTVLLGPVPLTEGLFSPHNPFSVDASFTRGYR